MMELTIPMALFIGALAGAGLMGAAFGWYFHDRWR